MSDKPDWPRLMHLAKQIPKQFHRVNRVVYVCGAPVAGPIRHVTPTHLTPDVVLQLQLADDIVTRVLFQNNLVRKFSQVPVVLFPVSFDQDDASGTKRSIGVRTFITDDFMTGSPACPGKDYDESVVTTIVNLILAEVPGISRVALDLTPKPPATTEWE
eukprot:c12295_g1_i1.p1 GENE.c12295_g1_i1~~c12295_g1_i1.p1  ORF type:complete len:159 (+),score=33.88 c12295_g1_i1:695-1171(+)